MVYDTRHNDDIKNRQVSDSDLRDLTGISASQERGMEQRATNGAAADILGRERAAAAGKPAGQKSQGSISSMSQEQLDNLNRKSAERAGATESGATRKSLSGKEKDSFYKPSSSSDDSGDAPQKGIRKYIGSGARMRRRLAIAGLISGLVGGGGAFAVFGILSGPFSFLQFGELLSQFHLSEKEAQGDSRTTKLMRNIRYVMGNDQAAERTRLGYIGNHIADKIETKMRDRGFTVEYSGGRFTGYRIDPSKLSSADYPDLRDRSPEGVAKYFKERLGAETQVIANAVLVAVPPGYFAERKLFKKVLQATGLKWTSPLSMRTTGVRMNMGFHWWKKLSGQSADERYREWLKKRYEKIKQGSKPPTASVAQEREGRQSQGEDNRAIQELQEAGNAAAQEAGAGEGKTEAMEKLRSIVEGKMGGTAGAVATGALGMMCFLLVIGDNIDRINMDNVIKPMTRMGMKYVSQSSQLQDNMDVSMEVLAWESDALHDDRGDWSTGRSVQAESGRAQSGPDIPPTAKLNKEGNLITRTIAQVPGLRETCGVLGNAAVAITLFIVGLLIAPVGTLITTAIGLALTPLIIEWVSNIFANEVVSDKATGPDLGNFANYGVRLAANDLSLSRGGLPLSAANEKAIADANNQSLLEDFQQQNLAHRILSPEDPKSFVAQVIRSQDPDPARNASRVAMGFMNIGKSFGSSLLSTITPKVAAQTVGNYDYGFPDYAFTPAEMDNQEFENGFANADRVAQILDANATVGPTTIGGEPNPDNYIVRVKTCFGVDIVKENTTITINDQERQVEQYAVKPPVTDQVPLQSEVLDESNKCLEGSDYNGGSAQLTDWTRIRMYIFDSQMGNAMGCYEGAEDDEVAKQACIDIGLEPSSGSSAGDLPWDASTGVPTCNTTAISAAPPGYKLSNCEDFEGTSINDTSFTAYNGGGGNTVSGRGRVASQCVVADSYLTLKQDRDGATCGTTSGYNQKEGYWEVRMRTSANDGGSSTAHPVLILWPGTDRWADGELDYFETDIGKDGGGFLHCIGNPSANCLVIPGNSGNKDVTPTAEDYKNKSPKGYQEWHSYGLMWKPDSMSGYIDGKLWWTSTDGSFRPRVPMHQTIQLDNLSGQGNPNPATMQADWVHVYAPN